MLEEDRLTEIFVERRHHRGVVGQRLQGAGDARPAGHAGGVRRHRPRARRLPLRRRRRPAERGRTGDHGRPSASERSPAPSPVTTSSSSAEPARRRHARRHATARLRLGPSIDSLLKAGQEILVQVIKDPLPNKGARVTHPRHPARAASWSSCPRSSHFGVSRRIEDEAERAAPARAPRIAAACRGQRTAGGGVIVRTAGEGRSAEEFVDRSRLPGARCWEAVRAARRDAVSAPTLRPPGPRPRAARGARPLLGRSSRVLWVDGEETYERIVEFLDQVQPQLVSRVKLYREERGPLRALRHRGGDRGRPEDQGLAQVGRLHRDQPDRGAGRDRRQHRPLRRPAQPRGDGARRPTSRRSRRSCARSGCATWAASSSSTSST